MKRIYLICCIMVFLWEAAAIEVHHNFPYPMKAKK